MLRFLMLLSSAVGVWLPILSYVLGAIDLTIAFRLYQEAKNLAE